MQFFQINGHENEEVSSLSHVNGAQAVFSQQGSTFKNSTGFFGNASKLPQGDSGIDWDDFDECLHEDKKMSGEESSSSDDEEILPNHDPFFVNEHNSDIATQQVARLPSLEPYSLQVLPPILVVQVPVTAAVTNFIEKEEHFFTYEDNEDIIKRSKTDSSQKAQALQ